ncbi:Clavaminate synthase-like protein [Mycena belliarum]|uniref:Clavaminate synthase-like protein n=1 Tax=Mycena belliarum TaxID=1033014 RepID=A0AAD6U500_9AGAR|nr:Clavaminate synthase-like protein [Mycena belliae]
MANRYNLGDDITRCVSCIRRWAGDTCRFQNLRSFYRDSTGKIVGLGFREEHKARDAPRLEFPNAWNTPIQLKHLGQAGLVYRPRESDVRATCDTCLTSIFSCSWMCRLCGREACAECFEQVKKLTIEPADASEEELTDLHALRDKHAHANPAFLVCMKKKDHSAQHFLPMSRFSKIELSEVINAMEALSRVTGMPLPDVSVEDAAEHSLQSKPSNGDGAQTPLDAAPSPISNDSDVTMICDGDSPSHPDVVPVASETNPEIPAHEIQRFRDSDLTEEIFRPLWAQGNPLLITDVGRKLKIDWSPEYFMKKYGTESCLIIECQSEINKRITVAEFFSDFGNYDGRENCWKLKDWPPSSDFKTSFPELYEDFSQAVPMPSYVRRDGALNIASHFPSNTVGPDLGPKMYNANANRVAGTKGSTRLHMDMADALNIMTYAAPDPEGKEGSAAWDLFRAQDSDQIRKFLRVKFAITALDPIHSQQVYLDDDSRRELWEKHGVKSYRVYQKAGEAVFIPAGCAHQVRNLSDCIKVAIDFVSPENIARCEKLTREFREQNHTKAWKEDVLQLRTMMWFAWLSCCRQERLAAS